MECVSEVFSSCSDVGLTTSPPTSDSEGPGEALRSAYDSSTWIRPVLFRDGLRSPCDVYHALCVSILRRTGKVVGCLSAHGRVNFGSARLVRVRKIEGREVDVRRVARLKTSNFASYLVDPASSHMLVSKIKPCMSKYQPH